MPLIFTGTGSDSGAGNAFICIPLWHAVACAEATAAHSAFVMITVAIRAMRRAAAGRNMQVTLFRGISWPAAAVHSIRVYGVEEAARSILRRSVLRSLPRVLQEAVEGISVEVLSAKPHRLDLGGVVNVRERVGAE
jgi:hypothetical protein